MAIANGPAGPVHYTVDGAGDPLVLLHGLGGDVGFWEGEVERLRDRFRLVAIDLRGSGGTPPSAGGHAIEDLADDVAAVLDDLGIDRAHVLGFSMGGLVAQAFAERHPARLDRLVLASTFARMNPQARMFLDAVHAGYTRTASAKQMFDLICPWLFSIPFLDDPANAPYLEYDDESIDEGEMRAWSALYLAQRAFDFRSRLAAVTAPTLVLAGSDDALVSLDDAEFLRVGIPDARLEVFAGAGHLLNVEASDAFAAVIVEFLDR